MFVCLPYSQYRCFLHILMTQNDHITCILWSELASSCIFIHNCLVYIANWQLATVDIRSIRRPIEKYVLI